VRADLDPLDGDPVHGPLGLAARPAARNWLLRAYLATGVPLAALTFAVPRYHMVLWGLLGSSASVAIVVGTFRNRSARKLPWLLVAAAVATFVTGDVVYDVLGDVLHRADPFPSVADAFYLVTYPLLAAGLFLVVRARSREKDTGALLDALIVTTGCALLSWIYLIQPYVHAADMTVFEKVISIGYPLGDIAILCVLARLVSAGGRRNWSLNLLTVGAGGLLAADVAYGAIQLNGSWRVGGPTDLGWVLFYLCWGAAALHPSMRQLTWRQPLREQHLSRTTLIVLSATTLVAPGLLVWYGATGATAHDMGIMGGAAGVLFVLVMARLTGMARVQAVQAGRERALRATGERLVAASELSAVDAAAVEAVQMIAGPGLTACLVTEPEGRRDRVVQGEPASLMDHRLVVQPLRESAVAVRQPDGSLVPGTREATRWTALVVAGPDGPRRRVLIGHEGRLALGSVNVLDALAVQLTLAADRVELAKHLHHQEVAARFRSLIQNASDVILVAQANGGLRSETPSIEAVLGYRPDTVGALNLAALLHPDAADPAIALIDAILAGTRPGPIRAEWRVRHADGHWLDMEIIGNDLSADVHVGGVVLTMRDVTDRKVLEGELRHQAFHDSLTGLGNRVLFSDRVDHALKRRSRSESDVAVLLIDVDDFKYVNDTLGHAAGDGLLVQVAERILGCLRHGDTAARLGGDEFAICLESASIGFDIPLVAQRILDATSAPYSLDGNDVTIAVSIGISTADTHTEGAAEMLRDADLALYAAKNAGKAAFHFFEPSLHEAVISRLERRAALDEAIQAGDLRLHYQPIVKLADRDMVGVEALVRWQHPTLGLIPPSDFVPLAEECGLVVALGQWVLNQACADLSRWQRRWTPADGKPMHVAVNVSPRQLQSDDFLAMVDDALARHHIDPSTLTLEITESVLLLDSLDVMARLDAIHARGITLALDDFGTGYSSLSYLHRFPIQTLKIDRSFVNGMGDDPERTSILTAIVSLAAGLGLDLVAEGIEHESQARQLEAMQCDYGQGFHLGRPMPADALDALIDAAATSEPKTIPATP
jgi:diguanylate cyclase (GGDEF)-like protein/PAS domain S-box-containing protein